MASIYQPSVPNQEEFRDYLQGAGPNPVTQLSGGVQPDTGGSTYNPAAQTQAAPSSSLTQTQTAQAAPQQPQAPAAGPAALQGRQLLGQGGNLQERLFSPIQQQSQQTQQQIGQLGESFKQAAGPTGQTFESRGGQEALNRYTQGGLTDTSQLQEARSKAAGLVGAQYTGPQALGSEDVAKTAQDIQGTLTQAGALRSGFGTQTVLQQAAPGITGGQARFEAKRLHQDPEYRRKAAQQAEEAGQLVGRLAQEDKSARALAQARQNEEAEIQRRARAQLTGQRSGIEGELDTLVQQRKAQQETAMDAYRKFQETGDVKHLQGVAGVGFDPGAFDTPAMQLTREAQESYKRIMEDPRYAAIAGYGALDLTPHYRGTEGYRLGTQPGADVSQDIVQPPGLEAATFQGAKPKPQPVRTLADEVARGTLTKQQADLLRQRQKALEQGGFDVRKGREGKYGVVAPLYDWDPSTQFGDTSFKGGDVRPYVQFDPGVSPARENVSTEGQRQQFNAINDLLGEVGRISEAGEPYRAAQMAAELDAYLADEEKTLNERKGSLSKTAAKWKQHIGKIRKEYKKRKAAEPWGNIVKGITGSEKLGEVFGGIAASGLKGDIGGMISGGFKTLDPSMYLKAGTGRATRGLEAAGRPQEGFRAPGATAGRVAGPPARVRPPPAQFNYGAVLPQGGEVLEPEAPAEAGGLRQVLDPETERQLRAAQMGQQLGAVPNVRIRRRPRRPTSEEAA